MSYYAALVIKVTTVQKVLRTKVSLEKRTVNVRAY